MQETDNKFIRQIRSFVRREGRMTEGQTRAMAALWPRFGLTLAQGAIDTTSLFNRAAPVILEIGFGMGHSLIDMAKNEPQHDFIGIEVHRPGVGSLLQGVEREQLSNVRVYAEDAVEVLKHCIADNSLAMVQIYFPDPWHKKRHHKRRLIQPDFVDLLRQKLQPGGVIHLATDWEHYAQHMMQVLSDHPHFKNQAGANQFAVKPERRPNTKFEKRGERLGHGVWDLLFEKYSE